MAVVTERSCSVPETIAETPTTSSHVNSDSVRIRLAYTMDVMSSASMRPATIAARLPATRAMSSKSTQTVRVLNTTFKNATPAARSPDNSRASAAVAGNAGVRTASGR